MEAQGVRSRRLWYGAAALAWIVGCVASALLIGSAVRAYPSRIAAAYREKLQKVVVPGGHDLGLVRVGAYAVYYEGHQGAYTHSEWPPRLDCSLTSKSTGEEVPLVFDYVPTNRYVTKTGREGVLIYSTTIKAPGLYSFACDYPGGRTGPDLVLAVGPNYIYELLREVWDLGVPILGGLAVLCGSSLLSFIIAAAVFYRERYGALSERRAGQSLYASPWSRTITREE